MFGSSWHAPPRGRGSVSGDPGGGATSVYTPYQSQLNKSPLSKSPFSKSPFSKSPTHRGLLAVFQEFCMVEQCLCDLRDVGDRESSFRLATRSSF